MVKNVDSRWYLHFLICRPSLRNLATMRKESLLKIKGVGKKYAAVITSWQVEESKRYYEKKRVEGKKHNQAIRSFKEASGEGVLVIHKRKPLL